MGSQQLMLAVDIGTSGARAVLFDTDANYLSQVRQPYATSFPQSGWSEQNPNIIADAVIEVLKDAVATIPSKHSLDGIVLSSQMYSILALDRAGAPLSNSLTWGDMRSVSQAETVRHSASSELPLRTGCPVQAIYPLAKIRWLQSNLELPSDVRFASIKDYVVFRLTGQFLSDWSIASASGLLNISTFHWDDEALRLCQITPKNLPELVSTRHVVQRWRSDISQYIGIAADTPLIMGAGDAPLANIGVGAIDTGTLAVNIGTSAAARVLTSQPQVDSEGRLWTYVADVDRWVIGGIIGSGGAVYEWLLKKLLFTDGDIPAERLFEVADSLASSTPPGADGLLFIPYFTGEQSPGWNPESKGLIYGMTLVHESRHYIRAAIEGITFSLLRVAKAVEEVRNSITQRIYLTGGLANSAIWRQTIADVFGESVIVPRMTESSARGAAILGWLALGLADGYEAFSQPEELLDPVTDVHTFYQQRYEAFCSLNQHLQAFLTNQEIDHDYWIAGS
jgi:gluconokinase